ncbi:hypothetical protein ACNHKD_15855 [Methylocystis sp. JAN1]|uniref:hypothetical protein n=1 Tax=Methylocystis sp. JAN1 TaxID=3397211 RepID=UPI003FA33C22
MSQAPRTARSFETIDRADLHRLAELALARIDAAFDKHPQKRALYEGRLLGLCLCQGAADHYLDPAASDGVHDFDIWAFFARRPDARLWNRKPFTSDFGPSKFGKSPLDPPRYDGRRVDVLWRCIPSEGADAGEAIRRYLAEGRTASARALRLKAAVMTWPPERAGEVVWLLTPSSAEGNGGRFLKPRSPDCRRRIW